MDRDLSPQMGYSRQSLEQILNSAVHSMPEYIGEDLQDLVSASFGFDDKDKHDVVGFLPKYAFEYDLSVSPGEHHSTHWFGVKAGWNKKGNRFFVFAHEVAPNSETGNPETKIYFKEMVEFTNGIASLRKQSDRQSYKKRMTVLSPENARFNLGNILTAKRAWLIPGESPNGEPYL